MKAIKVGRTERKHLEVPRDRTNTESTLARSPLIAKDVLLAPAYADIHKFRVGLGSVTSSYLQGTEATKPSTPAWQWRTTTVGTGSEANQATVLRADNMSKS